MWFQSRPPNEIQNIERVDAPLHKQAAGRRADKLTRIFFLWRSREIDLDLLLWMHVLWSAEYRICSVGFIQLWPADQPSVTCSSIFSAWFWPILHRTNSQYRSNHPSALLSFLSLDRKAHTEKLLHFVIYFYFNRMGILFTRSRRSIFIDSSGKFDGQTLIHHRAFNEQTLFGIVDDRRRPRALEKRMTLCEVWNGGSCRETPAQMSRRLAASHFGHVFGFLDAANFIA